MKAIIKEFNVNWKTIKNLCRQTISLDDSHIEPSQEWKRKLLICRHSPLRAGTMIVKLEDIPFYVMGHLVRHNVGVTPFVATSREDRTGIDRNKRTQTDDVSMQMNMNIEALMNISEKRLCTCADKETIKIWKEVIESVRKYDEDIAWACVPSCVRCGGCPETFGGCKFYENLMKDEPIEAQHNLIKRYDIYNRKV